ncbi:hypothetical protein [Endozoicomonas sp.]|uniref:hypothetical protein n=1 Tax=Endozoicomonas sp. TaxID=1892382 RepID=UPI00383AAD38
MNIKDSSRVLATALLLTGLTGCVLQERYHFSEEASEASRDAVQNIMASQILNPEAYEDNRNRIPEGEDGIHAANTLNQYRTGEGSESQNSSIEIDMDN